MGILRSFVLIAEVATVTRRREGAHDIVRKL
jgi:hypothetical protein